MTILDRLLFREVLKTLAVILIILLLVVFASNMVKLLGKAADGSLGTEVLLPMIGLQLLKVLGSVLPPAFFFAVLWVLGSAYKQGEMVGFQSAGMSTGRLYRSIFIIAVPLSIFSGVLVMLVVPWANAHIEVIKFAQKDEARLSIVRPGTFTEYRQGDLVVYTAGLSGDGKRLQKVFVQDRQQGKLGIVVAEEAYLSLDPDTGERFVILGEGHRYEGSPGQAAMSLGHFEEYGFRVPKPALDTMHQRIGATPTSVLWAASDLRSFTELQARLSMPLAVLIFALLAVPLARSQPRKDIYGRLGMAILVYFIFMNLQRVAERWMELGSTPSWLGMWWVSVLMTLLAALILFLDSSRMARFMRAVPRFKRGR